MLVDVALGFKIWTAESGHSGDMGKGAKPDILCAVHGEFLGRMHSPSTSRVGGITDAFHEKGTYLRNGGEKAPYTRGAEYSTTAASLCDTLTPHNMDSKHHARFADDVLTPSVAGGCSPSLANNACYGAATPEDRGTAVKKSGSFACDGTVSILSVAEGESDRGGEECEEGVPSGLRWREHAAPVEEMSERRKGRVEFQDTVKIEDGDSGDKARAEGDESHTEDSESCARARLLRRADGHDDAVGDILGPRKHEDERECDGVSKNGEITGHEELREVKRRRSTEVSACSPCPAGSGSGCAPLSPRIRVSTPGMSEEEVRQLAHLQMRSPGFPLKVRFPATLMEGIEIGLTATPTRCKGNSTSTPPPQTPKNMTIKLKAGRTSRLDLSSPRPTPVAQSPSRQNSEIFSSPRPLANTPSRRGSMSDKFDINEMVCTFSQTKRIELVKYKDISTPQWRVMSKEAQVTMPEREDDGDSSDEDIAMEAYERRHAGPEMKERLITLPIVQRQRAANAPQMKDMPPVSEMNTPKTLSRRNSVTSDVKPKTAARTPSQGNAFLSELNGIQICDAVTGLPTDVFQLATPKGSNSNVPWRQQRTLENK